MQNSNSENHKDIRISKTLSYILRHGALESNIFISPEGFALVEQILTHKTLSRCTLDDIRRVVQKDDKQRFTLRPGSRGGWEVRANQGHSIRVSDLQLTLITDASTYNNVIHGSYFKFWDSIKRQGLCKGKRNHIHFACDLPGSKGVISGARSSAEIFIYVDLKKALLGGLEFYLSSNNVILSPGNTNGCILPEYFLKVIRARDSVEINF